MNDDYWPWLIFGGIVVALVILQRLSMPSYRKGLEAQAKAKERLAEHDGEYAQAGYQISRPFLRGKVTSGNHAGVRFEHYIVPGGKNTPPRSAVSVSTTAPGEFHVYPESGITEALKQVGMVDEFQTGDASFDHKYYFSGSTDEYVRAVFGVRENLQRLRALFAGGFDQLEKDGTHLIASRAGAELIGIAELQGIVAQLAKFSLPPVVPGVEEQKFAGKRALYVLRAVELVIFLIGITASLYLKKPFDVWLAFGIEALPVVATLCAAILAAAYFGLKGRSMAARGMIELLAALPALALTLVFTLGFANEQFDGSVAQEHEVRLVKRYTVSGSKTTILHLEFESWRGRDREDYTVPPKTYNLAREGQVWRVRTRRGWLGYQWVESLAPST
jgi:hypothetical protein